MTRSISSASISWLVRFFGPGAGVAEDLEPGGFFGPVGWMPGELAGHESAFGVWHDDGGATIWSGKGGDAVS